MKESKTIILLVCAFVLSTSANSLEPDKGTPDESHISGVREKPVLENGNDTRANNLGPDKGTPDESHISGVREKPILENGNDTRANNYAPDKGTTDKSHISGVREKPVLEDGEDTRHVLNKITNSPKSGPRYVELVMVVDHEKYLEMDNSTEAVGNYCKSIVNVMNQIYSPLDVSIALVGVVIWTERNEIDISSDAEETLKNFLRYRRQHLVINHPNDNAQLITKQVFNNAVAGKALIKPICTQEYSGAVSTDLSPNITVMASVMSHMLGHNLGILHDTENCTCPDEHCVMNSSFSGATTQWSSCNIEDLRSAFDRGMDHCLKNKPVGLFGGPDCGNGFVEDGEECDCGPEEFCRNECCDARSCRLKGNATCGSGACCDLKTCSLKAPGTVCRPQLDECDLPEYCTGENPHCPDDFYKKDTEPCNHNTGNCYKGRCGSHSKQCKLLWRETGETVPFCYKMNVRGTRHGHCGHDVLNHTFAKCNEEDVSCGLLQCDHSTDQLWYGLESVSIVSKSYISTKGSIVNCSSASIDLGRDSSNPGMVPDGAQCGKDGICVNHKCVPKASLKAPRCPHNCYNNGYCNNLGNCHCKFGYLLPYCQFSVSGGSVNSGPAYS